RNLRRAQCLGSRSEDRAVAGEGQSAMSAKANGISHSRSAGKLTAVGTISALILAGTAVPASASEAPGNCNTAPTGKVTCVYDKPVVSHYTLHIPAGVTEVHIDARGAAGGD